MRVFIRSLFFALPVIISLQASTSLAEVNAASAVAASTAQLPAATLRDVVMASLETNPEYARIAKNTRATQQRVGQAAAGFLPTIDLRADTGYERTENAFIAGNSAKLYRNSGRLTISQMLYDGQSTKHSVETQNARSESSTYRAAESSEFTALDITQAFLEVLRQRELQAIAEQNVATHNRILATIKAGVNAGTVTDGDMAQAEARLVQAQSTLTGTEQALRQAEASFVQTTGTLPGNLTMPAVPTGDLPQDVEAAIALARQESPSMAIFAADLKAAEAEYKQTEANFQPRFDLEGSAAYGNNLNGVDASSNTENIMGVMKWNLYRGGADEARSREYLYRKEEARQAYEEAARRLDKDLRDTWAGVNASASRAEQFKRQADENEKVVNVYLDQFNLGRRTLLDLLDSQNESFVSKSNAVDASYTHAFGVFKIFALEGKLLSIMGLQRPEEARTIVTRPASPF